MLKKKCLAALSGILLAITVIAPFSFYDVHAATTPNTVMTWAYSFMSNSQTSYMYCDLYLVSNRIIDNAEVVITNNRVYRLPTSTSISFEVIECDGIVSLTRTNTDQGYNQMQQWNININNTSYLQVRIVYQDTEPNLRSVIANPQYYTAVQFFINGNITYGLYEANTLTVINQIHNQLTYLLSNGLTLDMSSTNALLQELIDLQSGNQASDDVVDNNDALIDDANDVISDYDTLTSTFDSSFEDSQEDMTTILQNTSLTAFTDAAVWFTTQLGLLYQSLGDMQILVAMPLILGIALFFIGRGNIVFKDPNTSTEQYSRVETRYPNGEKYNYTTITHTRTSRKRYD